MASAISNAEANVEFVRRYIKPMLTIVDFCGTAAALRLLNPKMIMPAEFGLSDGHAGRQATDLRDQADPRAPVDLAAALDILENFPKPQALLSELNALDLPVLCSIRVCADDGNSDADRLVSFETLAGNSGFSVVWRYLAGSDAMYLLAPGSRDAA